MFKKVLFSSLILFFMTACSQVNDTDIQAKAFSQLDHKQAVLQGHKWYKNDQGIVVRVHPDKVTATFANGKQADVAIPEDKFLLSIAPWITYTHPCGNHVPTGCTGELIGEEMHMSAVDVETGEELMNQMVTLQHDGFIDFWVPRNRKLEFTFHHGDKNGVWREAKEVLTTNLNSRTCITTMQLVAMNETTPTVTHQEASAHHKHH
ncbi:CueP family metal-binding protein [Shewanella aestuarii]|uniref:CueP family metal-binding protein n=1 Tax=Shewanella aestuarii TaxID=1028752 RepID=UPI001ABFE357|nr:CueP family metal-binding protein [Shewanella aestuarii]